MTRALKPGWQCIALHDPAKRRGLWYREDGGAIELCSGREGDDSYVRLELDEHARVDLLNVLTDARYALELGCEVGLDLGRFGPQAECSSCGVTVPEVEALHSGWIFSPTCPNCETHWQCAKCLEREHE